MIVTQTQTVTTTKQIQLNVAIDDKIGVIPKQQATLQSLLQRIPGLSQVQAKDVMDDVDLFEFGSKKTYRFWCCAGVGYGVAIMITYDGSQVKWRSVRGTMDLANYPSCVRDYFTKNGAELAKVVKFHVDNHVQCKPISL
eukprot:CAMPEP_0202689274 /NCGR_PEP_ID=MMETSP1385-20130828/4575_1 /ASSEMBLY_ACC=CAM_ASM_000861 /TAXON_ID=933848 /ORGANISM="Elphidium margaritaceum" /LENGTH=139 /DNA_ID=CAMNT_0049344385 /DNA_START=40 /DNA_END=459 /DNA_ORIENTATION=+